MIILAICAIFLIMILFGVVYFFRRSHPGLGRAIGSILALLHVALWIYTVHLILSGKEPDWPMYWMLFLGIDFPVSFIYILLAYLLNPINLSHFFSFLPAPLSDFDNFILPAIFFGFVGTWWWFTLPQVIIKVMSKKSLKNQ